MPIASLLNIEVVQRFILIKLVRAKNWCVSLLVQFAVSVYLSVLLIVLLLAPQSTA